MKKENNQNNTAEQAAINEVAHQVRIADEANKARSKALEALKGALETREAEFRDGVDFEFTEGKQRFCGKLVLKLTRKWCAEDIVIKE